MRDGCPLSVPLACQLGPLFRGRFFLGGWRGSTFPKLLGLPHSTHPTHLTPSLELHGFAGEQQAARLGFSSATLEVYDCF